MSSFGPQITNQINSFVIEAREDYVGLWQIFRRIKSEILNKEDVSFNVFEVVRGLLERGLLVGNLTKDGSFEAWNQQNPDLVISRINKEWQDLGRDPTIDDIAWFHLPH